MCSIIATNREIRQLNYVNYYTKFRGPDSTNILERDGVTFVHNLLSMTGDFTIQPFHKDEIVCLYNGEIYNYKEFGDYASDGQCLIDLYKERGCDFVKELDGEFAIALMDFSKDILLISTDVFGTKPLWYAVQDDDYGVASYKSALERIGFSLENIHRVKANTYMVNFKDIREIHSFALDQYKNHYEDWTTAFENSIRKRYADSTQKVFIGLSSGYDSGAIACELNNQGVDYYAYSSIGNENLEILERRHNLIPAKGKGYIFKASARDIQNAYKMLEKRVEEFTYEIYSSSSDYNQFGKSLKDDSGACALSHVCSLAQKDNRKIYLSGQGADEIISDYGFNGEKKFRHSSFGGLFPADLSSIFPWAGFFGSTQYSYLMKEEYISGAYGLEGRYPFLDVPLVQEFLWLSAELKNSNYKSVLFNYLKENEYPFEKDKKIGFSLMTRGDPDDGGTMWGDLKTRAKSLLRQ